MSTQTAQTDSIMPYLAVYASAMTLVIGLSYGMGYMYESARAQEAAKPWSPPVKVDASTGCEYIVSGFSGVLTPRLDAAGKPICGR